MDETQERASLSEVPQHELVRREHARKGAARVWEHVRMEPLDRRRDVLRSWLKQVVQEARVDTIINAVASAPKTKVDVPDRINRRRLREDIDRVARKAALLGEFDSKKIWTQRRERMSEIAKQAASLAVLLKGDPVGEWCLKQIASVRADAIAIERAKGTWLDEGIEQYTSVDSFAVDLRRLISAVIFSLNRPSLSGEPLWPQDRSNLEWLVTQGLPGVYHKWFGRSPGRARAHSPDGEIGRPDSPYIRFAEAVLKDIGRPATRGTIDAYWKDRDQPRRKRGNETP